MFMVYCKRYIGYITEGILHNFTTTSYFKYAAAFFQTSCTHTNAFNNRLQRAYDVYNADEIS